MRFREWSALPDGLPCGAMNLISDVPGLTVEHFTMKQDTPTFLRTGVSVLNIEDVLNRPVAAGCHVLNGYGKSLGLMQMEELGVMESPVYFTNTLSVGAIQQGAVRLALDEKNDLRTYNAVVMECSDGVLSDIRSLAITPEMAAKARQNARRDFELGSVGAGTGMVCFGFKGGIGSSSRRIEIEDHAFHVGALVLSNFGRREDLRVPGTERRFASGTEDGRGSVIMVVATDVPLMPHQLKRVARHAALAIGLLGSAGSHGSGDVVLAFSTTMRLGEGAALQPRKVLVNDGTAMTQIFHAAAWATAEAILDSMFLSPPMKGFRGEVDSLKDALLRS